MAGGGKSVEIRAGFVVLLGLAVLALGLFLVSGGRETLAEKKLYTVLFPNAGGVTDGSTVYVAGQKAGEVVGIATTSLTRDGTREIFVAVTIEVDSDLRIPIDSRFWISKSITNIVEFHVDYGSHNKIADDKAELFGSRLATFEELIDEAFGLVDDVRIGVRDFNEVMATVKQEVNALDVAGLRREAGEVVASLRRSGETLERILQENEEPVGRIVKRVDETTEHVLELSRRVREDWTRIDAKLEGVLEEAGGVATDMRTILEENRGDIRSLVQRADDAARRLAPVLQKLEGVGQEGRELLIELRPKLVKGVGNATAALENFKELTEDLKTAPWKLINKPSDEESRAVHFYNAARLYVDSAERIGEVIRDLDTLRRLGAMEEEGRAEMVEKTLLVLDQALKEFQQNQVRLAQILLEEKGAKK